MTNMSFMDVLKSTPETEDNTDAGMISEARRTEPETILRDAGFKIKMVTPTSFGTQIDFAKRYDSEEIEDLLKDFNTKIKDKSVFIVE